MVVEKQMMEYSKRLLTSIKDPRIQHLLKEIYDAELKHHTFMKRILARASCTHAGIRQHI